MRRLLSLFVLLPLLLLCDDSSENYLKKSLKGLGNGLWNGAGAVINGLEGTAGLVGPDQVYSFRVFNDAYVPICVVNEAVEKFFGIKFEGSVQKVDVLLPYTDSGDTFTKQQLLMNIWMLAGHNNIAFSKDLSYITGWENSVNNFADKLNVKGVFSGGEITKDILNLLTLVTTLGAVLDLVTYAFLDADSFYDKFIPALGPDKHYPKDHTYYYRAYVDKSGDMHGEYLGYCTTSSDFAGMFYNSSPVDISMTFTKDNKPYTATLEPGSFSMLESTSGSAESIRPAPYPGGKPPATPPSTLSFSDSSGDTPIEIPISPYGIASMSLDPTTSQYKPGPVMTYTYEAFQKDGALRVAMQGLAIGNYTQPVPKNGKQVVRDINPMACKIWVQSPEQFATFNKGSEAYIPQNVTFWAAYDTKDMQVYEQITTGTPIELDLLRPQISEEKAWLYIAALETTDSAKAKAFLKRLTAGQIGTDVTSASTQKFLDDTGSAISDLLIKPTPNTKGVIDDSQNSGVIGRVLVVDGFLPRGAGIGPYYYVIPAPSFMPSQLGTIVSSYVASSTASSVQAEIKKNVSSWIGSYQQNPDSTKQAVATFLKANGQNYLFSNPKAPATSREFNVEGNAAVTMITTGPISLATPPIKYNAGTNNFTFDLNHTPSGWPAS